MLADAGYGMCAEFRQGLTARTLTWAVGIISTQNMYTAKQAHQQMKEGLGLDHFEGRSWSGLHHHAVLTMIAFAFLQHLRLIEIR